MTLQPDVSRSTFWSDQRILVTGAGGYLGSWLSRALAALHPARLLLVCRGDGGPIAGVAGAETVKLDLLDREAVLDFFRRSPVDFVFHLAGKVDQSIRPGIYAEQFRANVDPVIHLTEALAGASLKRFVHIGTNAEYGVAECPHPTTARENPSTAYAVSKLAATRIVLARAASEGFPAVVGRPFLVYGEGQHPNSFLASALAAAQSGQPLRVTGGEQTRDFTSIRKFCEDVLALASQPAEQTVGSIYNLCTGVETPLRQVLSMIQETYPGFQVSYGALPYRKTEVMHSAGVPFRAMSADDARTELQEFIAKGGRA